MDDRRFDDLVKRLLAGRASRRLVATGLFATTAAGMPVVGDGFDALASRGKKRRKNRKKKDRKPLRCTGDSCDGTGGKECGNRDDCQCYRAPKGGNVCASALQTSADDSCRKDKDCPRGHVCVEGGPACGGRGTRFCRKACYA